jgi:hypothetical protein
MKHTLGISYPEARKRVQPVQQSYASAVKLVKTTNTVGIQTELTWPLASSSPKKLPQNVSSVKQNNIACQTAKDDSVRDSSRQQRVSTGSQQSRSLSRDSSKRDNKVSSDREEEMDTGIVPKQKPCPLSRKANKGGGKNPPPK